MPLIRVKLSGYLADLCKCRELVLSLDKPVTVRELLDILKSSVQALAEYEDALIVIRHGKVLTLDTLIEHDDEIELLPSLLGG